MKEKREKKKKSPEDDGRFTQAESSHRSILYTCVDKDLS